MLPPEENRTQKKKYIHQLGRPSTKTCTMLLCVDMCYFPRYHNTQHFDSTSTLCARNPSHHHHHNVLSDIVITETFVISSFK